MLLWTWLRWWLGTALLRLRRWICRRMLSPLRRLMLRGSTTRRLRSLRPGRGFFLARLVGIRLLSLCDLGERFGGSRRALRMPAG